MSGDPARLTFVINHAAFFVSHRLPLARAAKASGYEVSLVTGQGGSVLMERLAEDVISECDLPHSRVDFGAASLNPVQELRGLVQLVGHLRRLKPDLIHCASPKGVIYGGIAARLARVPAVVFSVSGQGYMQTGLDTENWRKRLIRMVGQTLSKRAYSQGHKRVIVQNGDDRDAVVKSGLARADEVRLIPGSGVDTEKFRFVPMSEKQPIVLFPARMLADKGLVEFVEAAQQLKPQFPEWRFVLAGTADYQNPTAIGEATLKQWVEEGSVDWIGHVDDMTAQYAAAAIVCLPSYREGMPKSLLEGASAGSAIVTTDVIGCREAIEPDRSGFLVPVRNSTALALALKDLIIDPDRRASFGLRGRRLAVERFSLAGVIRETVAIYDELSTTRD